MSIKTFEEKWRENLHEEYMSLQKEVTDVKTYDELISFVPEEAKNILEIGAGDGYIVRKLIAKNKNVIGTTLCKADSISYDLLYTDMHDLQFNNESYDVVIARHVLEHALSPVLVIREVYRVLKKGGLFLVETPITESGVEQLFGNREHFYYMMPKQWAHLIEQNLFKINMTEYSDSSFRIVAIK